MEPEKEEATRPIIDQLKDYAETRFKLLKYEVIERSTSIIADVIIDIVIIIGLVLTFLFASFTLALFLADVLHSYWQGFGCVALIYLLIAVLLRVAKHSFQRPIINAMIKKLFK
ncbi:MULTISPECIES: phage holin family protein [unclassified Mucilaginibacter]|uniref:phage holin family protein n=1 Tax=unclassified Mucilaginibacter TaxID=2617802 RepID=UPI002AC97A5B|nr:MULTISPECIES: phage holin family protein [unclassified Mucilaginibacter]MEB0263684.1 phage holin family protein [Mucilaginibacter sp. 10I4]MEB0280787.1 phage holin family protein [Mucilaginibacter sp. 10B2]MEB0302110.1 phage holin family protein [Mucilaginibacter sp. 5C4]WPX24329.1 phage holin family protein [Mucilaginibacter sp. 5C4]